MKRQLKKAQRRMNTCICMTESLLCSPETMTTLLIAVYPKQKYKIQKREKNKNNFFKKYIVLFQ